MIPHNLAHLGARGLGSKGVQLRCIFPLQNALSLGQMFSEKTGEPFNEIKIVQY